MENPAYINTSVVTEELMDIGWDGDKIRIKIGEAYIVLSKEYLLNNIQATQRLCDYLNSILQDELVVKDDTKTP